MMSEKVRAISREEKSCGLIVTNTDHHIYAALFPPELIVSLGYRQRCETK